MIDLVLIYTDQSNAIPNRLFPNLITSVW